MLTVIQNNIFDQTVYMAIFQLKKHISLVNYIGKNEEGCKPFLYISLKPLMHRTMSIKYQMHTQTSTDRCPQMPAGRWTKFL